ncbi:uncharacterized protein BDR25DRAFT_311162 [Lindgomyces ingoldianus]|uniref:Uncharacterized protein n=1 Tax=Lindgomyces ingoldianus TaxID=673940 RepID=A0ACB6R6D3_9PLEO|nr:uncharacterized protein BDR25DRAFT_311162 [Lindgomyces ingoldianus]KAF2474731.1 hypothetical protein BDR25DRAFT_311162 [Lindgomyces ingoldianus]
MRGVLWLCSAPLTPLGSGPLSVSIYPAFRRSSVLPAVTNSKSIKARSLKAGSPIFGKVKTKTKETQDSYTVLGEERGSSAASQGWGTSGTVHPVHPASRQTRDLESLGSAGAAAGRVKNLGVVVKFSAPRSPHTGSRYRKKQLHAHCLAICETACLWPIMSFFQAIFLFVQSVVVMLDAPSNASPLL